MNYSILDSIANFNTYLRRIMTGAVASAALVSACANATVIPLDLGDFFTLDPEVDVLDANTALMTDSEFTRVVRLTLDPWAGDPDVIIASDQRSLTFDYNFDQGANNIDEFSAYLFDAEFGPLSVLDSTTLFSSAIGSASFDLSGYIGLTLGLQFELYDPGIELGSMVTISNLSLVDPPVSVVPLPPSIVLFMSGIVIMSIRKFKGKHSGINSI